MSDSILYILPKDPAFVPDEAVVELAVTLAEGFVIGCDQALFSLTASIRYFHPGKCWGGVQCPACSTNLEERWGEMDNRTYEETGFKIFAS